MVESINFQQGRGARGRPIVNILPLQENERTAILPVSAYEEDKFVVMATAGGIVKIMANLAVHVQTVSSH